MLLKDCFEWCYHTVWLCICRREENTFNAPTTLTTLSCFWRHFFGFATVFFLIMYTQTTYDLYLTWLLHENYLLKSVMFCTVIYVNDWPTYRGEGREGASVCVLQGEEGWETSEWGKKGEMRLGNTLSIASQPRQIESGQLRGRQLVVRAYPPCECKERGSVDAIVEVLENAKLSVWRMFTFEVMCLKVCVRTVS